MLFRKAIYKSILGEKPGREGIGKHAFPGKENLKNFLLILQKLFM